MTHYKQLKLFFTASSKSWILLLLSFYFSWICPTESADRPYGYGITLVGQQTIEGQGRFYQYNFKAAEGQKTKDYFSFFSFQQCIDCFKIQTKTSWFQYRQRQNLLPTLSTFSHLQTHLPRSIASC